MRPLVTGVTLSLAAHAALVLAVIAFVPAPFERMALVEIVAPEPPAPPPPTPRVAPRAKPRETPSVPAAKPSAPRAGHAETTTPSAPAPVVRETEAERVVVADREAKRESVRERAERPVAATPVVPEAPPGPARRPAAVDAIVMEPSAGAGGNRTPTSTESPTRVPTSPVDEGVDARVGASERRPSSGPGAGSGAGTAAAVTGGPGDRGSTVARGTPGGASPGGATSGGGAPGGAVSGGDSGRGGYSGPRYGDVRKPAYPWAARVRGEEGVVVLSVRVDSSGQVTDVRVVESSGSSVLDDSAVSAVQQWRFDPAKRGGEPVESVVQVPVRFSLRER